MLWSLLLGWLAVFSTGMPTELPESLQKKFANARSEDQVRTCLVRSGTSRIIVVNRQDAPPGIDEETLALRLFGRDSVADGLGGDHYQLNKLAIWNRASGGGFEFIFFSLAPGSRSVSRGAECGHAAVAVALVIETGRPPSERGGPVRIRNVDTGQNLEITARKDADQDAGACLAKVLHDPPISMSNVVELSAPSATGDEIRWEVVPAGNIFAMVPGRNTCEDRALRREIQAVTLQWALSSSLPNASEEFIRTIAHDVQWKGPTHAQVHAVCHNGEERHNSLPVSGSSALCNHLTLQHLVSSDFSRSEAPAGVDFDFELTSVSGTEAVQAHASQRSGSWMIDSTSCNTNARLLIEGTAFLSP